MRSVVEQFENYAQAQQEDAGRDRGAAGPDRGCLASWPTRLRRTSTIKVSDKQALLVELDAARRLEMAFAFMEGELGVLQVEKKIRSRVKRQMEKTQREYYLNEQLKAIQRELGNAEGEEGGDEIAELATKIAKLKMSKEARDEGHRRAEEAEARWRRCRPRRPSCATISTCCWGCPGRARSPSSRSEIAVRAERTLDEDHYGLEKVKDRIVEYLAVQARTNKLKGPILCLVGPPGVGKTSLGRSHRQGVRGASSSASRWAACATRPRSAATAAPISVRCRARS